MPNAERHKHRSLYKRAIWHKVIRPEHLAKEPLCRACLRRGIENDGSLMASGARQTNPRLRHLVVDHMTPHRGDMQLFTDRANLQTLCPEDHNRNKQREEVRGYSQERGRDGWALDPNHPANRS